MDRTHDPLSRRQKVDGAALPGRPTRPRPREGRFLVVNVAVSLISYATVLLGFSLALSLLGERFAGVQHGSSVVGRGVAGCVIALSVVATVVAVGGALEIAP
jgi:hypothetical protein